MNVTGSVCEGLTDLAHPPFERLIALGESGEDHGHTHGRTADQLPRRVAQESSTVGNTCGFVCNHVTIGGAEELVAREWLVGAEVAPPGHVVLGAHA